MPKPRLLIDRPDSGYFNMAADEALFESAGNNGLGATLRIYGWSRPALSIGRRQKWSDVNKEACIAEGIDVVRRIGGGGAVYHSGEITYCFVQSLKTSPLPDSGRWRKIFSAFLKSFGLEPDKKTAPGNGGNIKPQATCFSRAESDEPTLNAKKWVGSARRKSKKVFLQHGSILLKPQPKFFTGLLVEGGLDSSIGLTQVLPGITAQECKTALTEAIGVEFSMEFETGRYTEDEKINIKKLESLKRREWESFTNKLSEPVHAGVKASK